MFNEHTFRPTLEPTDGVSEILRYLEKRIAFRQAERNRYTIGTKWYTIHNTALGEMEDMWNMLSVRVPRTEKVSEPMVKRKYTKKEKQPDPRTRLLGARYIDNGIHAEGQIEVEIYTLSSVSHLVGVRATDGSMRAWTRDLRVIEPLIQAYENGEDNAKVS